MKFTENYNGIKLDFHAEADLEGNVKQRILKMLDKFALHHDKIVSADIHFENQESKSTNKKKVSVRLGIPGNDPFASQEGTDFITLIGQVQDKIISQISKTK